MDSHPSEQSVSVETGPQLRRQLESSVGHGHASTHFYRSKLQVEPEAT
jgi:hypothetical protein